MDSYRNESKPKPFNGMGLAAVIAAIIPIIVLLVKFWPENPCSTHYKEFTKKYTLAYPRGSEGYSHNDFESSVDSISMSLKNIDLDRLDSKTINNELFKKVYPKLKMLEDIDRDKLFSVLQRDTTMINREYFTQYIIQPHDFFYKIDGLCEVKVGLELFTPKSSSQTMPPEITQFLEKQILSCEEFRNSKASPLDPINIVSIFNCLIEDTLFQNNLSKILDKYQKYFEIVPLGINNADLFFDKGEFRIPGIYKIIIDNIVNSYFSYILKYPDKNFTILCVGYADVSNVGDTGIPYGLEGKFSAPGEKISAEGVAGTKIGEAIEDNLQLSFARAYEGISYVENALPPKDDRYKLSLAYSGKGAAVTNGDLKLSRKITFQLIEKP